MPGWYTSDDCHDTVTGVVAQLPARGGECQYLAGWELSDSDCDSLDLSRIYTDLEKAARAADRLAERMAADMAEEDRRRAEEDEKAEEDREAEETANHAERMEWVDAVGCGD